MSIDAITATATAVAQLARMIDPEQFTCLTGAGSQCLRKQIFDDGHVWIGMVTTEPGPLSGWHHHGDYDTFIYVLEGQGRVEFADPSLAPVEFTANGGLVVIPKGVVHREVNDGTGINRAIVFRVGSGPQVVRVEGPELS